MACTLEKEKIRVAMNSYPALIRYMISIGSLGYFPWEICLVCIRVWFEGFVLAIESNILKWFS